MATPTSNPTVLKRPKLPVTTDGDRPEAVSHCMPQA